LGPRTLLVRFSEFSGTLLLGEPFQLVVLPLENDKKLIPGGLEAAPFAIGISHSVLRGIELLGLSVHET
jgi:hypothetical protein